MAAIALILLIVSFILIILVYIQSGKVKNIGSSIVGIKNIELFENTKKRGFERFIFWSTVFLIFLFFTLSLVLFLAA